MADLAWLSQEAKNLHAMFEQVFYSLALVLLLLGVVCEYFKLSIGGMPQFSQLVGRLLLAAILLNTYPEISNLIADVTDAIADKIGSLNSIKLVLTKYWDKLSELHMSWTSLKDSVLMLISFVTFFLLYISVYIADAAITYAWVLLYVFSPVLIALYVLPVTSGATKALFRSLFEVGAWKIVWSVLATLLWSAAFSQINQSPSNINFITAVSFNLILASSLLLTPFVVNALAGAGIASLAAQTAGIAAGAAAFSPGQLLTNFAKKKFSGKSQGDPDPGHDGMSPKSQFHEEKYSDKGEQSLPKSKIGGQQGSTRSKSTKGKSTKIDTSQIASVKPANQSNTPRNATVSFKEAVNGFNPPKNRSEHQRQPVQRELFNEYRSQTRTQEKK